MNKTLALAEKIFVIIVIAVAVFFAVVRLSLFIKPVQLTYRDNATMGAGEGRVFIFNFDKQATVLRYSQINFIPGDVPDGLQISGFSTSSPHLPRPFIFDLLDGYRQQTLFTLNASPDIKPGTYQFHFHLRTPLTGDLGEVPVNVVIQEQPDDVIVTGNGPVYRADLPGETRWPPVKETTVLVGDQKVPLTYRSGIDMRNLGYKTVLLSLSTNGTALAGKKITFSVSNTRDFTADLKSYDMQSPYLTEAALAVRSRFPGISSAELDIQIQAEGIGVIDSVPLTISTVQSPDDVIVSPGDGSALYIGTSGGGILPDETTIPVP